MLFYIISQIKQSLFKSAAQTKRTAGAVLEAYVSVDYPQRHEELVLYKRYFPDEYPKYDNYDAINVDKTTDIPYDYDGVMGVPITFLDKYSPEQFEIVRFRKGNDDNDLSYNGKCPYFRILIRKKGGVQ